ncbi:DNA-binding domain-containing protein [Luteolibacter arcticus]|uniref:DNA-binding domain-containing protein n=1 Tax=Luteolibacter arcticus TaxID=1581411 RepID=A0ABT3GLW7_9BACT|nr:DNA-binding domain-containing protein [Luteolibacter arcticus]MCW1924518.1 DNA-binding domain-containing protein [Luteolibacter arcticus]
MPRDRKAGDLARFQASLARAIMMPLGPGDAMRRESRSTADEFVKPNDRLVAADRLQIYNQQYWWRLLGSLGEDFRGLRAVLGERRFHRLAVAYLGTCGSTSWNLRDLGSKLGAYLIDHPGTIAPFDCLALDMASVEWARVVAFDGEQKPSIDPHEFAARSPERMTLGLQPYLSLLELRYPVDHLLKRLKHAENHAASNTLSGDAASRPVRLKAKAAAAPIQLVVHRSELIVYYKRIEPEAFRLLQSLRQGMPLDKACDVAFSGTAEAAEAVAGKVRTWFTCWMSFGWLCAK